MQVEEHFASGFPHWQDLWSWPRFALNWPILGNSITRQLILLESCSYSHKTWRVFYFAMKNKFLGFGFLFFVGDVTSGIRLGLLREVIGPWAPTARWKYFAQIFSGY